MHARSDEEVSALVSKMELDHNLYSETLDGWSVWRVLRAHAFRSALRLDLSASAVGSRRSRLAAGARHMFSYATVLLTARRYDLVVRTFSSALREEEGGRYKDVYFDSLIDSGYSAFKLDTEDNVAFRSRRRRAWRPFQLDSVGIVTLARLLTAFYRPRGNAAFFERLSGLLTRELGIDVPAATLSKIVSAVWWQSRLYRLLLERVRPRAVLVADTGEYSLSLACRSLGIRFIELQHGIFTRDHPDAIPAAAAGSPRSLILPDYLALYGDYWKTRLAGCAFAEHTLVPVGSAAIDRYRSAPAARLQADARRERLTLVFTSQGLNTAEVCDWIEEVVYSAPENLDWKLIVKLHPMYDPDPSVYDPIRSLRHVEVVHDSAGKNTYELLKGADFHLSIGSACHYDALGLYVPTIVMQLDGHELMLPLVDQRVAFLAKQPGDVWRITGGEVDRDPASYERFFAAGFVPNLRALVP